MYVYVLVLSSFLQTHICFLEGLFFFFSRSCEFLSPSCLNWFLATLLSVVVICLHYLTTLLSVIVICLHYLIAASHIKVYIR